MAIDPTESKLYLATLTTPVIVASFKTSDGTVITSYIVSSLNAVADDIRIYLLSDNSAYYISLSKVSSNYANICKVLIASPTSFQCQEIAGIGNYLYGTLMINDNQLFAIGSLLASAYTNYYFKFTFGNAAADWANKMQCLSGACNAFVSEGILSSDSTLIYAFFSYGSNPTFYTYFATFNMASGSVVGTRYKSNISCYVNKSTLTGIYVVVAVYCPSVSYLVIFNTSVNSFTNMVTNSTIGLYDAKVDKSSGRIVTVGYDLPNGYTLF